MTTIISKEVVVVQIPFKCHLISIKLSGSISGLAKAQK
jgi:hypothetical protein